MVATELIILFQTSLVLNDILRKLGEIEKDDRKWIAFLGYFKAIIATLIQKW